MNALSDHQSFEQASLSVVPADNRSLWEAYIATAPDARFFHQWQWGEIAHAVYGYAPVRFVARRGGVIVGVLAMSDVKSPFFGRSLVSTAFSVGGGVIADDEEASQALVQAAKAEGHARNVQYVELRGASYEPEGWAAKEGVYAAFEKPLIKDEKERLSAIPRKRRAEIRKSLKLEAEGRLKIHHGRDVDVFYDCYARSLRDLGTPIFPKRFIRTMMEMFGEQAEITIVEGDGAPIAALVSFYYKNRVMPYYVGAMPDARQLRGFDYLYWSMMARGVARGAEIFDFGRSKIGSPHFDYKKHWGFDGVPMRYHYALIKAQQTPNVNPNNPKFKIFTQGWKRLPVPVANFVGPILAPNFA